MRSAPPPRRLLRVLAVVALLGTLGLGLGLRAFLAGHGLPWGEYRSLRHAHSHLGIYGVLFPLAWVWWGGRGVAIPSGWTAWSYAAAALIGSAGFAVAGYGRVATIGSTVVLLVWIGWAWRLRRRALARRDWLASVPWAILVASLAIPAVAVLTSRDPPLARRLVQGFVTALVFGVVVPSALAADRAPRPPAPIWSLAVLGAALAFGPWPAWPSWLLLAWLGGLIVLAGGRSQAPIPSRILWTVVGLGMVAMATGLVPPRHSMTVAGLHLAILGPVLLALTRSMLDTREGELWVYLLLLGAFTLVVAAQALWRPGWLTIAAAWLGAAVVGWWVFQLVRFGWVRQ